MTLLNIGLCSRERWQYDIQVQTFRHILHCLCNTVEHNNTRIYCCVNLWCLYTDRDRSKWLTDWLTDCLNPRRRVLIERLILPQPVKKFPAFYGDRLFITYCTKACQVSLYRARLIQSTPSQPISLRSTLILSSHVCLGLPWGLFPSGSSYKHKYKVQNNIHNIANTYIMNYLCTLNSTMKRTVCNTDHSKEGAPQYHYIHIPVLITRVTYKKHQNYCIW
jgi:hypothetical protein